MLAVDWNAWNVGLGVVASFGFVAGFAFTIFKWATHGVARVAVDKSGVNELAHEVRKLMLTVKDDMTTVNSRLDKIESQYRNNGGSSARDLWDRVEEGLRHVRSEISSVDKKMERHLGFHEGADD